MSNKRGQVSIFVIVAIVIVLAIGVFFLIRGRLGVSNIPIELQPVYDYYESCINQETVNALSIAGSQGGRIYNEDYVSGSEYAPFSNQLNFIGFPVQYWFYISGNGLVKENVPLKDNLENEIARYVEEGLRECDFQQFYNQGFDIEFEEPEADIKINDLSVDVDVKNKMSVSKGEISSVKSDFSLNVLSKIGKFYKIAREVYDKEKKENFLENYSIDVLRLYAPVDGVEIQCAPKVWKTGEVMQELRNGLEANINSLKFNKDINDYFSVEYSSDESIRTFYSQSWPSKIQIYGDGVDNTLMIAETVGNEQGLGIIGFCYAPYHFVYDFSYPVMFQIMDGEELFQFPVVVIVDKNVPKKANLNELYDSGEDFDVCQFMNKDVQINLYDNELNKIDGEISYTCFNQKCNLGQSKEGEWKGKVQACLNGYIEARAEGYSDKKQLFSSNEEFSADLILDREYSVEIDLIVGGKEIGGNQAIISFSSEEETVSALIPDNKEIKLSEGNYDISVYVYGNSSIVIPASTKRECRDLPRGGIAGFFGSTREECFDIDIPETKIDKGLIGGGSSKEYLLGSELEKGKIVLRVDSLPVPSSLEQLQYNFASFDSMKVGVNYEGI